MKNILVALCAVWFSFSSVTGCFKKQETASHTETEAIRKPEDTAVEKKADKTEVTETVKLKAPERVIPPVPEKPVETILRTLYVSPDGKSTNEGTREAPLSLKQAGRMARAGDLVLLMDGTYKERLMVAHSGEAGKPIIFRAENRHQAILTETGEAIDIARKSYIVIDGLILRKVKRAIVTLDPDDVPSLKAIGPQHLTHHITITNCRFEDIKAPQGCRLQLAGDGFRITNNYFNLSGGDHLRLVMGRYHLIENNEFRDAHHACLAIVGIEYSVIRNNIFNNQDDEKLLEFNSRRRDPEKGRPLRHILIENNRFDYARTFVDTRKHGPEWPGRGTESSAMQFNGHHVIVRNNIIQRCQLGIYWYFSEKDPTYESSWNRDNRVFNNVFFENGRPGPDHYNGTGMMCSSGMESERWGNHVIKNNIFYRNRQFPWHKRYDLPDPPETFQVTFFRSGKPEDYKFLNNLFMCEREGELIIGEMNRNGKMISYTLDEFERSFPANASGNINVEPGLVDPSNGKFHLSSGSPCIDAGSSLTRTRSSGKGKDIEVEDSLYFCDGFRVVAPDVIRVGAERVWIEQIDYDAHVLTVNRSISWKAGDPVTLDYVGKGPDIGAFEFGKD